MKLISVYISGFGKLIDYRLDIDPELTAICMENGWGKSTLAFFVKAMLYGLDSTSKIKGEMKERERFKPWTSAPFGGWLEFEADNGSRYRIERSFGKKASEDSTRLFTLPDMIESHDYSDPIGLSLFGINAKGFIRSVFCSGTPWTISTMSTASESDSTLLVERFGDNVSESKNLEGALKKLDDRRKVYQTKRGDNGKIPELRREIFELESEIEELSRLYSKIDDNRAGYREAEQRMTELSCKLSELSERRELAAKSQADRELRRHYRELQGSLTALSEKRSSLKDKFPSGVPTDSEIDELRELSRSYDIALERAELASTEFDEKTELDRLSKHFSSGVPDADAISDHRELENRISHLKETRAELTGEVGFRRQSSMFASGMPNDDDIARATELAKAGVAVGEQGGRGKRYMAIGGAAIFAVGLILLFVSLWLGIAITLVGAAIAVFALIIVKKSPQESQSQAFSRALLDRFGYVGDDMLSDIYELKMNCTQYKASLARLSAIDDELSGLSTELSEFLDYYDFADVSELSDNVSRYIRLSERFESYKNERMFAISALGDAKKRLESRLAEYGMSMSGSSANIELLQKRVNELKVVVERIAAVQRELKIFVTSHEDIDLNAEDSVEFTFEELREQENVLRAERDALTHSSAALSQEYISLCDRTDMLPAKRERLSLAKTEYERAEKALAAITAAEEFLCQANQNLSDRYLTNVRNSFEGYVGRLLDDPCEIGRYHMDSSLAVLSEEAGKQRTAATLSRGRQDLVALCARLALADTFFEGKADFLILDDPFVNIDDERMRYTMELLRDLSRDRQIIYLTCSQSRMP